MLNIAEGILVLLCAAGLSANDSPSHARKAPFFSKRLSDGSTLVLELKVTEKTVKAEIRGDAPGGERFASRQEFHYQCRVSKEKGKHREAVWATDFTTPRSGMYPAFTLKDAELLDGKVFLMYGLPDGFLRVNALAKDASGRWSSVMERRIGDRPRALQKCRFLQDSGGLAIACIDPEPRRLGAREEIWDIRDGKLKKRAPK